jgi:predicted protein tyrosine phosphatase
MRIYAGNEKIENTMKKTKLLFVCTCAMDRSVAAASIFENNKKYEAKAVGISPIAETQISKEAIEWADKIIVMEFEHKAFILENFKKEIKNKPEIIVLGIENDYCRNDIKLIEELREKLKKFLK